MSDLLTVAQAAERLHCSERTVLDRIRAKTLRASKPGRRWVIDEAAITDYLEATSNQAPARRRRRRAS